MDAGIGTGGAVFHPRGANECLQEQLKRNRRFIVAGAAMVLLATSALLLATAFDRKLPDEAIRGIARMHPRLADVAERVCGAVETIYLRYLAAMFGTAGVICVLGTCWAERRINQIRMIQDPVLAAGLETIDF